MTFETRPLWYFKEIAEAVGHDFAFTEIDAGLGITGVSIDSRTLMPGDLFVAIKGTTHDGHKFVQAAFEAGAAAALVSKIDTNYSANKRRCLVVQDSLHALEQLGRVARKRMQGKVIAVTGSVGKTSVKEGLRQALKACGSTHVSEASYNNLWGVPLSLARMAADTQYGVFEIGMNHGGEILPLTAQVQPDIAVVTKISPAHMENFNALEDVALAKAEIFKGLTGMKLAVLPRDSAWFEVLKQKAKEGGAAHIFSFGETSQADIQALKINTHPHCSCLNASVLGQELVIRVGLPGQHMALNALLIMGVVHLLGADLTLASLALGEMEALSGRGKKHYLQLHQGEVILIDESYNANPASMMAALMMLGQMPRRGQGRRIAVLADMKELGHTSQQEHRNLASYIEREDIDLVLTVGSQMAYLHEALPPDRMGVHTLSIEKIEAALVSDLQAGDVVMLKGSNSMGLSKIVRSFCADHEQSPQTTKTREAMS